MNVNHSMSLANAENSENGDLKAMLARELALPEIALDKSGQCLNLPFNRVSHDNGQLDIAGITPPPKPAIAEDNDNRLEGYIHDQSNALVTRFFRRVVLESPEALQQCSERPLLYLANHQTGIESLLFMLVSHWLTCFPVCALAKDKHSDSFFGAILKISRLADYPVQPVDLVFSSREKPAEMLDTFRHLQNLLAEQQRSVLIHVEGTRALQAGKPVEKFSAINLDLAERADAMIVPVRFTGGLPTAGNQEKLEFPWQFGQQDCYIGTPIEARQLSRYLLKDKVQTVCERINRLGPAAGKEQPINPQPDYRKLLDDICQRYQLSPLAAVFSIELQKTRDKSRASQELLANLTRHAGPGELSDPRMNVVMEKLFGKTPGSTI